MGNTNQRMEMVRKNIYSRLRYSPTFVKPTDIIETETFVGLPYLQNVFKSEDITSLWETEGTRRHSFHGIMSLARIFILLCHIRFDDRATRVTKRKKCLPQNYVEHL